MRPKRVHRLGSVAGIRARLGAMCAILCLAPLAACGGEEEPEGTIPPEAAQGIVDRLNQLEGQVEDGACDDAERTAVTISEAVENLPEEVDGELRETLVEASANVVTLTREDCQEPPEEEEPPLPPETGATGAGGVSP